jgi:hypothetical protein
MPSLDVPDFESDLLWDIALAVARRGKAIRYHGTLELSRADEEFERLNLDFTDVLGFRVRLSIWSDSVVWLGITKRGPRRTGASGWAYRDEFHSRLDDLTPHDVVERFEQTIQSPAEARNLWPACSDDTRIP